MSATTRRSVITTNDIIEAYDKHGDDFIIVDVDNKRDFKNFCNYININIKKANGDIVNPTYCKMTGSGMITATNIREPSVRQYEQIRLAFSQYDKTDVETDNMKAIRILCTSYKNVIKKMAANGIITHHKDEPRKKNSEGLVRPVLLISTDPKTPMVNTIVNRQTQEVETVQNPTFWVNVPKKIYRKNTAPPPKQFDDLCYKEEDGSDGKPFLIQDFDVTFFDIERCSFDPTTGHKKYALVGEEDENGNIVLNNTNIHKFLVKNTILFGSFKFGITTSARGAKLEISLCGSQHIKQGEDVREETNTEEELAEFVNSIGLNPDAKKKEYEDDNLSDEEPDT